MVAQGLPEDPEEWEDAPLIKWPCEFAAVEPEPESEPETAPEPEPESDPRAEDPVEEVSSDD